MDFPERLRQERTNLGLSQQQLADLAGLEQAVISNLERGRNDANRATLCKLAIALELTPTEFAELVCPELLGNAST